jgi:hypothetical protein
MKKSQRGNECTMVVGHCSTRVELLEVAVELRNKIWNEDYLWVFHARQASSLSQAHFEKRRE